MLKEPLHVLRRKKIRGRCSFGNESNKTIDGLLIALHRGIECEQVRRRGSKRGKLAGEFVKRQRPCHALRGVRRQTFRQRTSARDTVIDSKLRHRRALGIDNLIPQPPAGEACNTALMDKMSGHGHIARKGVAIDEQNPIATSSEQQAQRAASTSRAYDTSYMDLSLRMTETPNATPACCG
jgi:hypothetical protein